VAFTDIFKNWRVDPFSGDTFEEDLEEVHQIDELESTPGIYGIISNEVPYFSGEIGDITAVQVANEAGDPLTGGTEYNEVTFSTVPAFDEFRVDYVDDDVDTFYSTARFNFNSSEDGNYVKINYKGTGTVVKGRYQLNQVSVVPTNLGVEGGIELTDDLVFTDGPTLSFDEDTLYIDKDFSITRSIYVSESLNVDGDAVIDGEIKSKIDGAQIWNQLDPALEKFCFSIHSQKMIYSLDGENGKRSLKMIADGTPYYSYYSPGGTQSYIPIAHAEGLNYLFRLKKSAGFVAGTFELEAALYDKDKALINYQLIKSIGPSDVSTGYQWLFGTMGDLSGFGTAIEYVSIRWSTNNVPTGDLYCDYIYGQSFGIPLRIMSDIMANSTGGHWVPNYQTGHHNIVWLETAQTITLTTSAVNYAITDSDLYSDNSQDSRINSVIVQVRLEKSNAVNLYEGSSGTNDMCGVSVFAQGGSFDLLAKDQGIFPISYFSVGGAYLRMEKQSGTSVIDISILAFILG